MCGFVSLICLVFCYFFRYNKFKAGERAASGSLETRSPAPFLAVLHADIIPVFLGLFFTITSSIYFLPSVSTGAIITNVSYPLSFLFFVCHKQIFFITSGTHIKAAASVSPAPLFNSPVPRWTPLKTRTHHLNLFS